MVSASGKLPCHRKANETMISNYFIMLETLVCCTMVSESSLYTVRACSATGPAHPLSAVCVAARFKRQ